MFKSLWDATGASPLTRDGYIEPTLGCAMHQQQEGTRVSNGLVLNTAAVEDAVFSRADAIWPKYSDSPKPANPHDFADGIIETFDQYVHDTPGRAADVLRAASRSIATNGRYWTNIRRCLDPENLPTTLKRPVGGSDEHVLATLAGLVGDTRDRDTTIDEWALVLNEPLHQEVLTAVFGGGYTARKDADGIGRWAQILAADPGYYHHTISAARDAFAAADSAATPEVTFLCVATYFGKEKSPREIANSVVPQLRGIAKWPRMGLPLACEFLRNLGWNGFKPDRHIVRLLGGWWTVVAPDAATQMQRIGHLVGTRHRVNPAIPSSLSGVDDLQAQLVAALTGIAITPDDNYTRADNLLWLLGSEVETKRSWAKTGTARLPENYLLQ